MTPVIVPVKSAEIFNVCIKQFTEKQNMALLTVNECIRTLFTYTIMNNKYNTRHACLHGNPSKAATLLSAFATHVISLQNSNMRQDKGTARDKGENWCRRLLFDYKFGECVLYVCSGTYLCSRSVIKIKHAPMKVW